jgi:hypothetical protein
MHGRNIYWPAPCIDTSLCSVRILWEEDKEIRRKSKERRRTQTDVSGALLHTEFPREVNRENRQIDGGKTRTHTHYYVTALRIVTSAERVRCTTWKNFKRTRPIIVVANRFMQFHIHWPYIHIHIYNCLLASLALFEPMQYCLSLCFNIFLLSLMYVLLWKIVSAIVVHG